MPPARGCYPLSRASRSGADCGGRLCGTNLPCGQTNSFSPPTHVLGPHSVPVAFRRPTAEAAEGDLSVGDSIMLQRRRGIAIGSSGRSCREVCCRRASGRTAAAPPPFRRSRRRCLPILRHHRRKPLPQKMIDDRHSEEWAWRRCPAPMRSRAVYRSIDGSHGSLLGGREGGAALLWAVAGQLPAPALVSMGRGGTHSISHWQWPDGPSLCPWYRTYSRFLWCRPRRGPPKHRCHAARAELMHRWREVVRRRRPWRRRRSGCATAASAAMAPRCSHCSSTGGSRRSRHSTGRVHRRTHPSRRQPELRVSLA